MRSKRCRKKCASTSATNALSANTGETTTTGARLSARYSSETPVDIARPPSATNSSDRRGARSAPGMEGDAKSPITMKPISIVYVAETSGSVGASDAKRPMSGMFPASPVTAIRPSKGTVP